MMIMMTTTTTTATTTMMMMMMMDWILDNSFVLSISFHDGRVMVNYPWDDRWLYGRIKNMFGRM